MAEVDSLVPLADRPELFIGLIAPLGVELDDAIEVLKSSFKGGGYDTEVIRMSALLRDVPAVAAKLPATTYENERID